MGIRALNGAYSSVIVGTQAFAYWGKTIAVSFFGFFLPTIIAASATGSLYLAILARVLYEGTLVISVMHYVHFVEVPMYNKLAEEQSDSPPSTKAVQVAPAPSS